MDAAIGSRYAIVEVIAACSLSARTGTGAAIGSRYAMALPCDLLTSFWVAFRLSYTLRIRRL